MINFFRKIRRQLLTENKFSRYLIYAIGEITLVMIGILLALQVNNWNETNKIKKLEKSTLIEISNALESDLIQLSDLIRIRKKQDSNVSIIFDYLENDSINEALNRSWQ